MEVKINREIRSYTESMFFGLSMRQFFFSLGAAAVAVILYFALKPHFGTETVSWVCILGAVPFAAMGFVTYHGMTAEQFIWAWIRSELLEPKELHFESVNTYELLINAADTKSNRRRDRAGSKADSSEALVETKSSHGENKKVKETGRVETSGFNSENKKLQQGGDIHDEIDPDAT